MILFVTIAAGALAILAELVYARLSGRRLYRLGDTVTNLSAAAFEHVFTVLVAAPVYAMYVAAFRYRLVGPLPFWAALPLGLVLMDLGFYTWHRASHRVMILWFGHAIHHSSEEFNFSVAARSSGWAKLTQRLFYLPMAFAGIPVEVVVLADAMTTLYAMLLHNRFVPKLGVFEKLIVTPSHHRVHHARNPEYLDKNFAAMFIFWDYLFGTYKEETALPIYGLTKPLLTHNVGWARFHVLFEIADRMRRARTVRDKLLAPFLPPSWDPDGDHVTGAPTPQVALEPAVGGAARAYALAQHVVLFLAIVGFTFVAPDVALLTRLAIASWLCASLAIVGALLDGRRWAIRAEAARWIAVAFVAATYVIPL
jgi:sterol desaturase/sphingolipid hydroxylase (fatty acid hydroxylase superfamily)